MSSNMYLSKAVLLDQMCYNGIRVKGKKDKQSDACLKSTNILFSNRFDRSSICFQALEW